MQSPPDRSVVRPTGATRPAWAGWGRALGVLALCTAIAEAMHARFDIANIIMVYLAGVVYVAFHEGARVSAAMVLASIFVFDLVYVPPRWGLNPLNPKHFFTFAVMLVVGLLISRLASHLRSQTLLAEGRAQRAQVLSELSADLSAARSAKQIGQSVTEAVQRLFGAHSRLLPEALGGGGEFALRAPGGTLGVLQVDLAPGTLSEEDRELLQAFAMQAALALERCTLEQKSAEAQVAAEAERLRSTLLSGISHDFRTPLTTIVGAATSLLQQDERLDADSRQSLTRSVRDQARRLHALVSDLLDLTRMEEGAVQLAPEWCPADDLVAEALAACAERTADHTLEQDVPGEALVWCDPRLLEQALSNLVGNALRYTPAGSRIVLSVRTERGQCTLAVADNGPGLVPGTEESVFRKFQRSHQEPAGGGFGLGLAICAAVARLHQGRIVAANRPEGGASFTITLPQPPQPAMAPEGT